MRRGATGSWLVLALLLAGCGSAPPIPAERHYRLPPPTARHPLVPPPRIERVRAPGPLRERPLLWSDDDRGLVLQQQHYHSWLAPPPELVRRHLVLCLGGEGVDAGGADTAWRLRLELERFERVLVGDGAMVAVALTATGSLGERRLERRYSQQLPVVGREVAAAVPVFAAALDAICGELAGDLEAASAFVR